MTDVNDLCLSTNSRAQKNFSSLVFPWITVNLFFPGEYVRRNFQITKQQVKYRSWAIRADTLIIIHISWASAVKYFRLYQKLKSVLPRPMLEIFLFMKTNFLTIVQGFLIVPPSTIVILRVRQDWGFSMNDRWVFRCLLKIFPFKSQGLSIPAPSHYIIEHFESLDLFYLLFSASKQCYFF